MGISRAPRASENSRFELNLEADATEPHARADGDLPKVTRINSPDERRGPGRLQPSLSPLYSHRARRSDDDQSPSARHKARQQLKKKRITSSVSSTAEHFQKKGSPRSGFWRACVCACVRSLCPSLLRLHRVRISPPTEWQEDHRDAPPSPQHSLISGPRPLSGEQPMAAEAATASL